MAEFQLNNAKKGDKLKVLRIEGGKKIKKELNDKGIKVGKVIEVLSRGADYGYKPLVVSVGGGDILIPRGIASKIYVGDKLLIDFEVGEGVVNVDELNKSSIHALEKLGIYNGVKVEIKGYENEKLYTFKVDDNEIKLCSGESAKILVDEGGKIIQATSLSKKGKICGYIGGEEFLKKIKEKLGEDIVGKEIEKISVSEGSFECKSNGEMIFLKVGDESVVIGKGKAEKIWVDLYNG
ncbi:FeoA family protein [Methanotorris formicicus]|uniref:FeoA family protein n=1 Tax=Methanotorris formicicus Mc-S-70 TaxID=647171 RepID=H1KZW2_9EURY|nr:FeoA family protein [Methanotorris formicicus]EHP85465.1 FeoA family protein [Methanotorris formicicus Mc-S-70]